MKRIDIEQQLTELSEELNSDVIINNSKEYKKKYRKYKSLLFRYKLHYPFFWILLVILLGLTTYTVFHTPTNRLFIKSVVEIWDSIVYYFKSMFSPVPIDNSGVSFLVFDNSIMESVLPTNFDVFGYRFLASFQMMVNPSHLGNSWAAFVQWLNQVLVIFMLLGLPVGIMIYLYYNKIIFKFNNRDADYESRTLKISKWFKRTAIDPTINFLRCLYQFFKNEKYFYLPIVLLIIYNLNVFSIFLTILAWYFYFVFSTDFISLWYLVCKVLIAFSPLLRPIFYPFWIVFIAAIIIKLKMKAAYNKLEEQYASNDEFISDLGVITGIYGPPGAGKNILEVQIATQMEVLLRRQAFDQILEIRAEFPNFPFRFIEQKVEELKASGDCVNKIQIEYYFKKMFKINTESIYGYDLSKEKIQHYDKHSVKTIQDELLDYAKLYYVYISRLTVSTYSLRYDKGVILDEDNNHIPGMIYDFFHRDLRDESLNERAKIMDLNMLRLNKQLDPIDIVGKKETKKPEKKVNPPIITLFDFGILTLSEFGKDRGNRYTNQSRKNNETTPMNDGTTNCFGIIRHLTTIRHKQYGRLFWDEQKLSSFSGVEGAMAETNIFISKQKTKHKLTLPLWFIEGVILEWALSHYQKLYNRYIHIRNDNNIFSWYFSHMYSFFANLQRNLVNTFGYKRIALNLSGVNINGAQEKRDDRGFFIQDKIVYADRYETDCYKGFFDGLKRQADKGINQLPEFSGRAATQNELSQTNGYFPRELEDSISEHYKHNDKIIQANRKKDAK